jgi:hypothetical protein
MSINSIHSLIKVRSTKLIIFDETFHGHRGIDQIIVTEIYKINVSTNLYFAVLSSFMTYHRVCY